MSASLDATPRAAAQNASSPRRSTGQRLARWASGSPQVAMTAVRAGGGIAVAVVLWWIVASAGVLPAGSVPTPLRVAHDLIVNRAYYATNAGPTTVTALEGFALAAVVSLVFGALGSLTALLERSVSRVALAIYCLPLPALLPLISSLAAPGEPTRVTMATLFSFFPMLVGVLTGLRSTPADSAAIVHCAGGGRVQILLKVGLRSALPNIMSGMRIAGPGALLGALVAEFSGAQDGLGVALVVSQQKLQTAQTWGLAIVATVIGGLMYALLTTIARWLHADPAAGLPMPGAGHEPGIARRVAVMAVPPVALLALWIALVRFAGASPLVFKSPQAVLGYLFKGSTAAMHRSALTSDWGITMEHTGIIFAIGLASAAIVSCILVSVPLLARLSAPLLLASQCVPQIAFIPLLVAICGRGVALIAVTGLLVVFFPAMIVIITALEERSQSSIDVIRAYGGGKWAVLRFGRLPGAIPGLLSAARISIPLSLFGALVTEWLVTGTGISEAMSTASVTFDYTRLWADVAAMTVTVTVLYAAVSTLYERSRRRFAG